MIQTFIEKNRKLLRAYYIAAQTIGWVLVILSAIPALLIPYIISGVFNEYPGGIIRILGPLIELFFRRLPLGVVLLGVAQFIKYVSERQYQPGWLLRHGSGVLYLFAILMITGQIIRYCFYIHDIKPVDSFYIVAHLLADVAVMLILIGLGNILKRIMPVIEESKSLV